MDHLVVVYVIWRKRGEFDNGEYNGKIKQAAILKEPKANCLVYCRLEDVKEK